MYHELRKQGTRVLSNPKFAKSGLPGETNFGFGTLGLMLIQLTDGRMNAEAIDNSALCQACGACCSYSSNWPRFTIEDDATLDLIPAELVNEKLSGMRCDGNRCSALIGQIGVATSCEIYAVRPEVCRTCQPGDAECAMARRRFGMTVLPT